MRMRTDRKNNGSAMAQDQNNKKHDKNGKRVNKKKKVINGEQADSREVGVDMPPSLNTHITETNTKQKVFGMKNRTRIGTWNVRTMLGPATLAQTIKEMEVLHIKVLGLSEIRWPGQGERLNSNGSLLLYSGRNQDENRANGGGTRTKTGLMVWVFYWIKNCSAENNFYQQLSVVVQKIHKGDILIIMGDLNAKVGNNNELIIMGDLNAKVGNNNDGVEKVMENELIIGGTLFKHNECRKITWVSPDGGKWVQIKEIIHGTARKVIGYREQERKKWISEDTWNMIKKRKELKAKLNGMDGNSVNYEDIRKERISGRNTES
ncbi:hypothetical protein QE152_g23606 [Popillia japonica]|uniref:Endonuclease/exonuclease/phosphatase domain-containing protein n=1 Tax=Popillia japonica TaxID=7064 RepID=A0AAW1KGI2_POPJA